MRIYEDDPIATSNITAKTNTDVRHFLTSSILLSLTFDFSDDVPRKFLQGLSRSHKYGIMPGQICLVLSRSPCFGIPELVQIGECRDLESHFQDYQQSRKLGGSFLLFPSAKFLILQDRDPPPSFLFWKFSIRSRELLQSVLIILGPGGFHRDRMATKQQSRSLAVLVWRK